MWRRIIWVAVLGSVTGGAEPGFKEIFAAFSSEFPTGGNRSQMKRAAFERALQKRGAASAIRHFAVFEKTLAEIQKLLDRDLASYRKVSAKWWAWRRKYERDHQRRYKRPPAEYPVPTGLNDAFIAAELRFKTTRSLKMREQLFQAWAIERTARALDDKARRALVAGLRHKNPHQRLRCARLLEGEVLDGAIKSERHPAVLGELLDRRGAVTPFLNDPRWQVRAGAIRGATRAGATGALEARLPQERGRLRDDIAMALKRPGDGPLDLFGVKTSSRALVICTDVPIVEQIRAIPDGVAFGLVINAAEPKVWRKKLTVAEPATRATASAFLEKHRPDGLSDLHGALLAAFAVAGDKADTLVVVQATPPREPQMAEVSAVFYDPRQIALEIVPVNDLHGMRVLAFGPSGGGQAFYLQMLTKPFGGVHVGPE